MTKKELQFERIYEKTKDFGRTQFVREIQRQINDNKKKDKKIKELQKKAELEEHYKKLYSEVKKQKADVVEYIQNTDDFDIEIFNEETGGCLGTDLSKGAKNILRMLGETDDN